MENHLGKAEAKSLDEAWPVQRMRLQRELRRVSKDDAKALADVQACIAKSAQTWQDRRQAAMPCDTTPAEGLPISEPTKVDEIQQALSQHRVVVVVGETGSGKSTQLPKLCVAAGFGVDRMIAHTQPRRLAAYNVAARVAEEMHVELGSQVGVKVRFDDRTKNTTLLKVMTDGMLLSELSHDRFLDHYEVIIVDEAHERSMNIDLLMAHLKRLLSKRKDLKVIVTSATIDHQRFADYFADVNRAPVPVVQVSGKTYPVETVYVPAHSANDLEAHTVDVVTEALQVVDGDILVFQPTERDVHHCVKLLQEKLGSRHSQSTGVEVLPLYARLTGAQQGVVFKPGKRRRVIVSTNVAESSVTVPRIHAVVDTGLARLSRYASKSGIQRLPIEEVSQASCNQRKGRCGRIAPGICFRLFSQENFNERDAYTLPEIHRVSLAHAVLQVAMLGLGNLEQLDFLDPPASRSVREAKKVLFELGALDAQDKLSPLGKKMSRLPVEPRVASLLLRADDMGCLAEMLVIASALEAQDPRERPLEKQAQADQAHAQFKDSQSDFMTYYRLWYAYHEQQQVSRSAARRWCKKMFVNERRMREWIDLQHQLQKHCKNLNLRIAKRRTPKEVPQDTLHKCLLSGFLSGVAKAVAKEQLKDGQGHAYHVAQGGHMRLWPGSVLSRKKPEWLFGVERVETREKFLRCVAPCKPEWVIELAPHLLTDEPLEATWSPKIGASMIREKINFMGLQVGVRDVPLRNSDFHAARDMFIEYAMLGFECEPLEQSPFTLHNQDLMEKLRQQEVKLGKQVFIGWQACHDLWDKTLPKDVCDVFTLRAYRKKNKGRWPKWLWLEAQDMRLDHQQAPGAQDYPDVWHIGEQVFDLRYEKAEGERHLVLEVPADGLSELQAQRLEWLVPGMLASKCEALIRTLPKPLRRRLQPIPEIAQQVSVTLPFGQGDLKQALADALGDIAQYQIKVNDFDLAGLPENQSVCIEVKDKSGAVLESSISLRHLKSTFDIHDSAQGDIYDENFRLPPAKKWQDTWGVPLPETHGEPPAQYHIALQAFTLCGVAPRAYVQRGHARQQHRLGLRELGAFAIEAAVGTLTREVAWQGLLLQASTWPSPLNEKQLRHAIALLVSENTYLTENVKACYVYRSAEQWQQHMRQYDTRVDLMLASVWRTICQISESYQRCKVALDKHPLPDNSPLKQDINSQLAHLMGDPHALGFLGGIPWAALQHYPRYLEGILHRFVHVRDQGVAQDTLRIAALQPYWIPYLQRTLKHRQEGVYDPEREQMRWQLEEYRISLFAQQLGTQQKVSPQRLQKQWEKVLP